MAASLRTICRAVFRWAGTGNRPVANALLARQAEERARVLVALGGSRDSLKRLEQTRGPGSQGEVSSSRGNRLSAERRGVLSAYGLNGSAEADDKASILRAMNDVARESESKRPRLGRR
jgi:hypothetical protein